MPGGSAPASPASLATAAGVGFMRDEQMERGTQLPLCSQARSATTQPIAARPYRLSARTSPVVTVPIPGAGGLTRRGERGQSRPQQHLRSAQQSYPPGGVAGAAAMHCIAFISPHPTSTKYRARNGFAHPPRSSMRTTPGMSHRRSLSHPQFDPLSFDGHKISPSPPSRAREWPPRHNQPRS
jgi:hypothetical protein